MNILTDRIKHIQFPPIPQFDTIVKRNLLRYFSPGRTITQAKVYFGCLKSKNDEVGNPRLEARFGRIFTNLVTKGYLTEHKDRYYTVKGDYANRRFQTEGSDPEVD